MISLISISTIEFTQLHSTPKAPLGVGGTGRQPLNWCVHFKPVVSFQVKCELDFTSQPKRNILHVPQKGTQKLQSWEESAWHRPNMPNSLPTTCPNQETYFWWGRTIMSSKISSGGTDVSPQPQWFLSATCNKHRFGNNKAVWSSTNLRKLRKWNKSNVQRLHEIACDFCLLAELDKLKVFPAQWSSLSRLLSWVCFSNWCSGKLPD